MVFLFGESANGKAKSDRVPVGVVLAGGCGSRLGGDKARAELGSLPLILRPLNAIAEAGMDAVVVAKSDTELPPLSCRVIRETTEARHPLCGIIAALFDTQRPVVAIACDMPFVSPELLRALALIEEPLVAVAHNGRPQPLLARYGPELLPELEEALAREEPLRRTVESLGPYLLDGAELARFGEPQRLFFNVNDATDLAQAARLL